VFLSEAVTDLFHVVLETVTEETFRAAIRGTLVALIQKRSLDMEKCRYMMLSFGVPEEDFPEQGFQGILELAGRVNPDDLITAFARYRVAEVALPPDVQDGHIGREVQEGPDGVSNLTQGSDGQDAPSDEVSGPGGSLMHSSLTSDTLRGINIVTGFSSLTLGSDGQDAPSDEVSGPGGILTCSSSTSDTLRGINIPLDGDDTAST
jgi:hypothetical protein